MNTRQYFAGRVREVGALAAQCATPPAVIVDTWADLCAEVERSLEQGDDARAKRLIEPFGALGAVAPLAGVALPTKPLRQVSQSSRLGSMSESQPRP